MGGSIFFGQVGLVQGGKRDFSSANALPLLLLPTGPGPIPLACHHFSSHCTDRNCSTSQNKQTRNKGIPMEKKNYTEGLGALTGACTAEFAAPQGNNIRHLSLCISSDIK